ncbi:MAG: SPASM domain-containing protein, partial [Bdellovibrionales bacterium]|nr:SPASM domain-containing protein [Bdellovibrionales bacterium]
KIGSLKENSLQQIWFSKKAQDLRNDMVKGRCPNCYFSCKIEPSLAANYKYLPSFSLEKLRSS